MNLSVSEQYKQAKDLEGNDCPEYFHCSNCDKKMDGEEHYFHEEEDKVYCESCEKEIK